MTPQPQTQINSTEDLLKTLPSQEGLTITHNGRSYFRPYQTFEFNGETFEGLREMKDRKALFQAQISKYLPTPEDRKAYLDVGCNMGYFVRAFTSEFEETVGVDYNPYYTWFAKTVTPKGLNATFHNYDINSRGLASFFGTGQFDMITSLSMIEYITNKEQFVKDIFDLLRPGGLCIFEGHSMDINLGHDKKYETLIRGASEDWTVERLDTLTDNGINAPSTAMGRPVWVCLKKHTV